MSLCVLCQSPIPFMKYSMLGKPASLAHTSMTDLELALAFGLLLAHLSVKS